MKAKDKFEGKSSFPTWLVGILRNKIVDHFRRIARFHGDEPSDGFELDSLFLQAGTWRDHWDSEQSPRDWTVDSADAYERREFMAILGTCLEHLPRRLASAFSMREIDGMETDEICKVLEVSPTYLWVVLHRARMHLRRCLEVKWLEKTEY